MEIDLGRVSWVDSALSKSLAGILEWPVDFSKNLTYPGVGPKTKHYGLRAQ